MNTSPGLVTRYERSLCWSLILISAAYVTWGFLDDSVTRAVVLLDFASITANVRQAFDAGSLKPIWDNAESHAMPAVVVLQAFLVTQYIAHLAARARILRADVLWILVMVHALLVTHIGFYRLGRDRRFLSLSDNWFWTGTIGIFAIVLAAAFHANSRRKSCETPHRDHDAERTM